MRMAMWAGGVDHIISTNISTRYTRHQYTVVSFFESTKVVTVKDWDDDFLRFVSSSSSMRPQRHTAMAMMVMELSVTQHILQYCRRGARVWELGLSLR